MAVAFDALGPASSAPATDTSGTGTISWTHTCGASASYLLVAVTVDNGGTSSFSCTYNSIAMTLLQQVVSGDNGESGGFISLFGLANPSTGPNTVQISGAPTSVDVLTGGSLSFTGAGALGTIYTSQSGVAGASSGSVTIPTTTSGNIVAAFAGNGSGFNSLTPWISPATTEWSEIGAGGVGCGASGAAISSSTGSAVTVSWTQSDDWYGAIGVELLQNMTITGTFADNDWNDGFFLDVHVLTGAAQAASQTGATATSNISSTSITTTTVGSQIFGVYADGSVTNSSPTMLSGSTQLADFADGGAGITFLSFKSTSATSSPGSSTFGANSSASGFVGGSSALAEILSSGTIAIDSSGPSPTWSDPGSGDTATSAAFTPVAGSLIVAIVGADANPGHSPGDITISDTLGLTWHQLVFENSSSDAMIVSIFVADAPGGGGGGGGGSAVIAWVT